MIPVLREIASGLRFPEGPIAMQDGSFLVVEIERQCLSRITPDGQVSVIAYTGGGPNGAAMGPDGKCYVCNNGGHIWREGEPHGLRPTGPSPDYTHGWIDRIDLSTGKVERLFERSDKAPLCSPNDIVFDRTGGFWFSDLGKTRHRDMDRGALCYAKDDEVREVIFPMISPNGVGLSKDEGTLYVAETQTGRLWSFELSAPGQIRKKRWPDSPNGGTLLAGSSTYQMFDSLAVDADGNICVATVFNGGITVVSADGSRITHIPMPDIITTNICFGGAGLRTAYITLSSSGRLVAMDWMTAGLALNFPG